VGAETPPAFPPLQDAVFATSRLYTHRMPLNHGKPQKGGSLRLRNGSMSVGIGGQTVEYDQNFNVSLLNGWSYGYDAEKHLMVTSNGGGSSASFVYDALGRCVKRTINGVSTRFVYDGWKAIMEFSPQTNHLVAWNVYGPGADEILWRWVEGVGDMRYQHDIHGNVTALLGFYGGVIERYTYDVFGSPTAITDASGNPHYGANGPASWWGNRFMFQGREFFPELGIYDYRHRMYHPGLGRFLQTDPTGFDAGDMNLFRYCDDDPVDKSDPTGLDAVENASASPEHAYSYYLQPQLKPEAMQGWIVAHMTGRATAEAYQCAAAAAILAGTWRGGGLHRAPEATKWRRGPDVAKSPPRIGSLIAKGWDANGHYFNSSNLDAKAYRGNHSGIFLGFVGKDHKHMKILDQFIVSQNKGVTMVKPMGVTYRSTEGYSRVDSSAPFEAHTLQVVLRPPAPEAPGDGEINGLSIGAGISHPPIRFTPRQ
jgi:RHS repeat-associated protein